MLNLKTLSFTLLLGGLAASSASAKLRMPDDNDVQQVSPVHHFYTGGGFDGAIFSTATMQRPGMKDNLGTLRFSLFFNAGVTFNYDFNNKVGLYTGVDIKNVGFIEKIDETTVKHRTYNVGVPLGIKFGNMKTKNYFFAGAGIDVPFNYKEKEFESRSNKHKFNEWFSNRTPAFMGYVFAGLSVNPGVTVKVQYYLTNFMNSDYSEDLGGGTYYPYAGYDIHLLMVSLGFNMHYSRHDHYGKRSEVKTAMLR
jgi:hypothetical protein